MGGKSKKLIYDRNSARVLVVGGPPLERNCASRIRQILAHNDDKRKKIMFDKRLERFDETAGQFGDAVRVREEGTYHRNRVGAGFHRVPSVRVCDAPDRHERKVSNCGANSAKSFQTE